MFCDAQPLEIRPPDATAPILGGLPGRHQSPSVGTSVFAGLVSIAQIPNMTVPATQRTMIMVIPIPAPNAPPAVVCSLAMFPAPTIQTIITTVQTIRRRNPGLSG